VRWCQGFPTHFAAKGLRLSIGCEPVCVLQRRRHGNFVRNVWGPGERLTEAMGAGCDASEVENAEVRSARGVR
jgi:hypothetical protein